MAKHFLALALLIAAASASFAQVSFGGGAHSNLAFSSFAKPLNEIYGIGLAVARMATSTSCHSWQFA